MRLFRIVLRPYCRGVLENSYPLAAVDALLTLAADGQVTVRRGGAGWGGAGVRRPAGARPPPPPCLAPAPAQVEIKQLEFPLEWDVASVSFGSID